MSKRVTAKRGKPKNEKEVSANPGKESIMEEAKLKEAIPDTSNVDPKQAFDTMVESYLNNKSFLNDRHKVSELEVRFTKKFTKMDYDNVAKAMFMAGYQCDTPDGVHILRVMPQKEFVTGDDELKKTKQRIDIIGLELVEEYCRLNDDLKTLLKSPKVSPGQINFTIKSNATKPVDFHDFNFRASYQIEYNSTAKDPKNLSTIEEWNNLKKTYRYLNRVRFRHPIEPFYVDISIVKGSKTKNRNFIPKYSVKDAEVFDNQVSYEIELEVNNRAVKMIQNLTANELASKLRQQIRTILSAIQGTNYPIGNMEIKTVLGEYMELIHGPNYDKNAPIRNRNFIGPSTVTLTQNCFLDPDNNPKNILTNYCVTDKADGLRSLLFVSSNGRIYMIDMNMNVVFTGAELSNKDFKKTYEKSILDGEFVKYQNDGTVINLFAAFDIYYQHGECVSTLFFDRYGTEEHQEDRYRLDLLTTFVDGLNEAMDMPSIKTASMVRNCMFQLEYKKFYKDANIFNVCKKLLENMHEDMNFELAYKTDGIIFTPMNAAVGGEPGNKNAGKLTHKQTWEYSFKWKDSKYNTVDFLVKVKKNDSGEDDVQLMEDSSEIQQYKTIILHCGYSKEQHGFLTNPFIHMIHGTLPSYVDPDNEDLYKPVPFTPTQPADDNAKYCNVLLDSNGAMRTIEGDYFEENTIIEFTYDTEAEGNWKWKPLRVRHDKTAELLSNARHKGYGNDYKTANGVWSSIHYPIEKEMLMTGRNIPITSVMDDDVYYNKSDKKSYTRGLRDFHNLYVKKRLIVGASKLIESNQKYLIDYAVGKAGDLSKWREAKLDFVYGIDIHRDNIENHVNGACARYLNEKMKYKYPDKFRPKAAFVSGNSEYNIRDGSAFDSKTTSKALEISKAIFGIGSKEKDVLGKGVYELYGYGEDGFHISSCQFALHYFFKDIPTVHSFVRNIAECTKSNGYFIGTCYDGQTVFNLLQGKEKGGKFTVTSSANGAKIAEITKDFPQEGFHPDSTSVGYRILVFQETINKQFAEYLVNFEYFKIVMEHYGFEIISDEKAAAIGLTKGSGLFADLYSSMNKELNRPNTSRIKASYGTASQMTEEEKQVSFLNRYFIFQKVRDVKASEIYQIMAVSMDDKPVVHKETEKKENVPIEVVSQSEPVVPKIVKIKRVMKKRNEKIEIK